MQHSHPLSAAELGQYPRPYAHGLAFSTVICQGDHYLPWLQHRLEQVGLSKLWAGRLAFGPHNSETTALRSVSERRLNLHRMEAE